MKKSILFMLFLFSVSYSVFGQISVSGRVVSEDGALPGATVQIKGTNRGTVTDIEGYFMIVVDSENDTLVFRFLSEPLEIVASEIKEIVKIDYPSIVGCYFPTYNPLVINYWSGLFYNPYGLSIAFTSYNSKNIDYIYLAGGYSTNFNQNHDFFGEIGIKIFQRETHYKFQKIKFNQTKITTHSIQSGNDFGKIKLLYGIGFQRFEKFNDLENNKILSKNGGVMVGLMKDIWRKNLSFSAKSFYWFNYWAWEADITKGFKRKIHTSISYRQTTQDFKEINLALGYIF